MFLDFETSPEAIYDYPLPTTEEKAKEQVKVWSDSGYFYSVCLKGNSEDDWISVLLRRAASGNGIQL